ncbi:MAG: hypothetical protein IOC58_12310 [Methylobacterium sp.]|jgi:hypothetical protein|nr:hypothetical protein [Methylobacterium sp.]MCA4923767.1 hypothetical protein [Methylobacterium sp.]
MSENMNDAMPIILRKIQEDIADFRRSTDTRLAVLEDLVRKQRRDTAGLLVMAKAVTGDFAEQVALIEDRVAKLEARGAG